VLLSYFFKVSLAVTVKFVLIEGMFDWARVFQFCPSVDGSTFDLCCRSDHKRIGEDDDTGGENRRNGGCTRASDYSFGQN